MQMPEPIATAPTDGRKVRVQWRDRDGVENTSIASYRAGDPETAGWWTFIDSDTQKRIQPHSWSELGSEDEED
jgi:hypothetical protein